MEGGPHNLRSSRNIIRAIKQRWKTMAGRINHRSRTSTLFKLLIPFLTRPFLWESSNGSLFRGVFIFQGQGTGAVKNGPHGLWVRRDPLLVYLWGVWPQSPREPFYWSLFLGSEQSQKGFPLNNSPTDHYFLKIVTGGGGGEGGVRKVLAKKKF